jgi:hypothetical protein
LTRSWASWSHMLWKNSILSPSGEQTSGGNTLTMSIKHVAGDGRTPRWRQFRGRPQADECWLCIEPPQTFASRSPDTVTALQHQLEREEYWYRLRNSRVARRKPAHTLHIKFTAQPTWQFVVLARLRTIHRRLIAY